jgi:hypothetical protein
LQNRDVNPQIIARNRECLRAVDQWITDEIYRHSRSGYGCPERLLPMLNLPLDEEPTYTDLLVYCADRISRPVHYLELGVSVGKNFYVLANVLEHALMVGFDWERINPLLARHFHSGGVSGPLAIYTKGTNRLMYLQGDIDSSVDWSRLAGIRFNLVFSDACHQPEMLYREFEMLERHELLDGEFVMVWDDLDALDAGPITRAFLAIGRRLQQDRGIPPEGCFRIALNGWLGQHEHRHTIGVVNSIGLTAAAFAR